LCPLRKPPNSLFPASSGYHRRRPVPRTTSLLGPVLHQVKSHNLHNPRPFQPRKPPHECPTNGSLVSSVLSSRVVCHFECRFFAPCVLSWSAGRFFISVFGLPFPLQIFSVWLSDYSWGLEGSFFCDKRLLVWFFLSKSMVVVWVEPILSRSAHPMPRDTPPRPQKPPPGNELIPINPPLGQGTTKPDTTCIRP